MKVFILFAFTMMVYGCADPTHETVKQPVSVPPPKDLTLEEKHRLLCDQERLWAYQSGIIDLNEWKFLSRKNLSPVYKTPGVRQSGIEGFYPCAVSLQENGFLKNNP